MDGSSQSLGEPDSLGRLRSKSLHEVVGAVARTHGQDAGLPRPRPDARNVHIVAAGSQRFREIPERELLCLHEGNFARYKIRPSEFAAWQKVASSDATVLPPRWDRGAGGGQPLNSPREDCLPCVSTSIRRRRARYSVEWSGGVSCERDVEGRAAGSASRPHATAQKQSPDPDVQPWVSLRCRPDSSRSSPRPNTRSRAPDSGAMLKCPVRRQNGALTRCSTKSRRSTAASDRHTPSARSLERWPVLRGRSPRWLLWTHRSHQTAAVRAAAAFAPPAPMHDQDLIRVAAELMDTSL